MKLFSINNQFVIDLHRAFVIPSVAEVEMFLNWEGL